MGSSIIQMLQLDQFIVYTWSGYLHSYITHLYIGVTKKIFQISLSNFEPFLRPENCSGEGRGLLHVQVEQLGINTLLQLLHINIIIIALKFLKKLFTFILLNKKLIFIFEYPAPVDHDLNKLETFSANASPQVVWEGKFFKHLPLFDLQLCPNHTPRLWFDKLESTLLKCAFT